MKHTLRHGAAFLALLLASTLCQAQDASPHATALQAAGFKVNRLRDGGRGVDFGQVKTFDDASLNHIAELGDVRHLSGSGDGIDDATLARLVKAAPMLEYLFINGSTITDESFTALAKLPMLKHFGLHHGPKTLTGKGLLALKDNRNFTSIEFGGMGSINDESVGYIAALPNLRAIRLGHTSNTRASLPLLVTKNPLLEKFSLNPHFEPARFSAADLATLAPLKNLRELDLNDMVLPYDNGLEHLKALTGLQKLSLEWSLYTEEDLAKLQAALPGVEIKSTNRAKAENLALWNERVAKMTKEARLKP